MRVIREVKRNPAPTLTEAEQLRARVYDIIWWNVGCDGYGDTFGVEEAVDAMVKLIEELALEKKG